MEDSTTITANPESMEDSQEGRNSEKIDLSLDDIIKLNRKEQKANKAANKAANTARNRRATNRNTVLKKLARAGEQQRIPFRQGQYQTQQGPYRSRYMGPSLRGFYRVKPYNFKNTAIGTKGVSPLNRRPLNKKEGVQFGQRKPLFRGAFYQPYRGPVGALRRPHPPFRGQRIPPFPSKQRQGGARPFLLNRGFPALNASVKVDKYQKVRGWRKAPPIGSTLTVSLPNSKANSEPATKAKQTTLLDRSTETGGGTSPQPKGIPLKFNFKAAINQTGVTLNERFTGMRIRTGPGQGPQMESGRGRGRGRGRGSGRGSGRGRTVTLQ